MGTEGGECDEGVESELRAKRATRAASATRATRVKDAALCVALGLAVGSAIWTVGELTYDPSSPPERPVCPTGGVRVTAGPVNAAMGLRDMALTLRNCGTRTYRVEGYPLLRLLDQDQQPVTGVSVVQGHHDVSSTGSDDPPRPVVLRPGETATANVTWRNTVTGFQSPTDVPYLTVRAKPGGLELLLAPEGGVDLGTTGKLGVGPWQSTREEAPR